MKYVDLVTTLKGMIIGGTMLVPGLSGGSMAMLLGVYQHLISSVSSFSKEKRKNILFLFYFSLGGCLGILIFANPLFYFMKQYPMPVLYFFLGAVFGGIPFLFKQAKIKKPTWKIPLQVGLGILLVSIFTFMPRNLFQIEGEPGFIQFFLLIIAGFIAAIALVLPGISVSYLLLLIGLYQQTMWAISNFYVPFLFSLGIGLLIGIALTTKLLEYLLIRYPQSSYLIILGFLLGSVTEIFPGIPEKADIPFCLLTLLTGFFVIQFLAQLEAKNKSSV